MGNAEAKAHPGLPRVQCSVQTGLKRGLPISSLSPEQLHVREEAPACCAPGFTPLEVKGSGQEGRRQEPCTPQSQLQPRNTSFPAVLEAA